MQETQVWSLGQEDPWRREWLPTPLFLPGESHGQRSLADYSPWGCRESDTTERLNSTTTFKVDIQFQAQKLVTWGSRLTPKYGY